MATTYSSAFGGLSNPLFSRGDLCLIQDTGTEPANVVAVFDAGATGAAVLQQVIAALNGAA